MREAETFASFFKEGKQLAKEYIDTKLDTYRLQVIRTVSKSAGYFIWIMISLVLVSLFIVFAGIVTGLWLSKITGSYIQGFGLTTLAILVLIIVVGMLRKSLFVNPIIRALINQMMEKSNSDSRSKNDNYGKNDNYK